MKITRKENMFTDNMVRNTESRNKSYYTKLNKIERLFSCVKGDLMFSNSIRPTVEFITEIIPLIDDERLWKISDRYSPNERYESDLEAYYNIVGVSLVLTVILFLSGDFISNIYFHIVMLIASIVLLSSCILGTTLTHDLELINKYLKR